MFENSFAERVSFQRRKVSANSWDLVGETRSMPRERAYTDCRLAFSIVKDRVDDYKNYRNPGLYVTTAFCAGLLAAILSLLFAKNMIPVTKVMLALFVFLCTIIIAMIIKEIILDNICRDIARQYERIDAHEINRPAMVNALKREFEFRDPDYVPDYEASEDEEDEGDEIFIAIPIDDEESDETEASNETSDDSDSKSDSADDSATEEDHFEESKNDSEGPNSECFIRIDKLIRDLYDFIEKNSN